MSSSKVNVFPAFVFDALPVCSSFPAEEENPAAATLIERFVYTDVFSLYLHEKRGCISAVVKFGLN